MCSRGTYSLIWLNHLDGLDSVAVGRVRGANACLGPFAVVLDGDPDCPFAQLNNARALAAADQSAAGRNAKTLAVAPRFEAHNAVIVIALIGATPTLLLIKDIGLS